MKSVRSGHWNGLWIGAAAMAFAVPLLALPTVAVSAPDPVFGSAIAAWQMDGPSDLADRSPLKVVGAVRLGVPLSGKDRAASLAAGGDGLVARLEGGYLDAGQGTEGRLNPQGSALTVAVRLRADAGSWGKPIFSKHGGHDRLVYNLFSFESAIGFELGTRDHPGMTQLLAPLPAIGPAAWHTVLFRFDGRRAQLFVDGVVMDEAEVTGPLRTGNTLPVLIGAESQGDQINGGWRGQIDYVALWDRALADAEVERLAGGSHRVAQLRRQYLEPHLLPPPPDLYRERLRPQFHFTARQWTLHQLNPGPRAEGWLNDPNGLICLHGVYHLFAQRWNRCWIHAVSRDLVHWTEVQPAFWEDRRFGGGVQSGGAVYDRDNTSGLARDPKHPPLVAFWAGNDNRSQCISYSLDEGRTWTKYAGNPVLVFPERDPKVFWYAPDRRWIMVLSGGGSYHFFQSTNLLAWTRLSGSAPDSYECPDLFQLPLDGDLHHQKWVLVRGNGMYSIGEFDGKAFTPETPQLPCDQGPNFYATQSWGDIAGAPGRRVQIAWMRGGKYPAMPFNQQMTFPCDLLLRSTAAGPRLYRRPVPEIRTLQAPPRVWRHLSLSAGNAVAAGAASTTGRIGAVGGASTAAHAVRSAGKLPLDVPAGACRIVARVELPAGAELTFRLHGVVVTLIDHTVTSNSAPVTVPEDVKTVEILMDTTSIETFINDGAVSLSACYLPTDTSLSVECTRGAAVVEELQVFQLRSSWPAAH